MGSRFRMTKSTPPSTATSASNAPQQPISPTTDPENSKPEPHEDASDSNPFPFVFIRGQFVLGFCHFGAASHLLSYLLSYLVRCS